MVQQTDETVYAGRYSQNLMVQPSLVLQPSVRMGSIQNTVLSMNVENHKMSPAVEVLGLAVLSPSWQLKGLEDPLHLT